MLETIMNSYAIFWAMGVVAGAGIICKIVVVFSLKRLVKAAGKMGKSSHKLMKLVKAKFEHAFMLSDSVGNVGAFVEKYIYEYKVFGLRLHTLRYFGKQSVWLLGFLGLCGAFLSYSQVGMEEITFQYGAIGLTAMVVMFLLRILTDEEHQLEVVRTYMIDYLENVCAPRYGKQQALKYQRMDNVMNETIIEQSKEQIHNPDMKEVEVPDINKNEEEENMEEAIKAAMSKEVTADGAAEKQEMQAESENEKKIPQEVILREILEEFLA